MVKLSTKYLTLLIVILSFIGAIVSGYLWYHHIVLTEQREDANLIPCTIGDSFNCDTVNTSSYSELFGIPIAIFGLLSYIMVGLIGVFIFFSNKKNIWLILNVMTGLMSLYGIYLFYISKFMIGAYCIFCIVTYLCSFGLFGSSYLGWKRS